MADSGFLAKPVVNAGHSLAVLEYTIAPQANLTTMVNQTRRALLHLHTAYPSARIVVAGHSAGGQLALMMQWLPLQASLATSIKGIFSLSGVLDLSPVKQSYANEALQLTVDEVERYSPLQLVNTKAPDLNVPLVLAIAQHEPDAFRQFTLEYKNRLAHVNYGSKMGILMQLRLEPRQTHRVSATVRSDPH
eukprot:TRINITY_DN9254_c0_g1_i4.p1 TRINITY_DN9254_c0_g1~~TRINITY_DN9254_c0_g1_i4.p1  ORF type:complete len:212 (+),score=27.11 TRINITY_DN9254_c0_g1_i4:66-638(+)